LCRWGSSATRLAPTTTLEHYAVAASDLDKGMASTRSIC
jgi:hypothetical protein